MRKFILIGLFVLFTPITLLIATYGFWDLSYSNNFYSLKLKDPEVKVLGSQSSLELYTSIPPLVGSVSQEVQTADARPVLIKNYLEKYQSPLLPYANYILQVSDKYQLDYGLILAIAQCESNVCKKIPEGSYNCWGFGNGESKFSSWEFALEYVAKTLKEDYYDMGLVTPQQIMPKYVPPSVEKGGPWAKCVDKFLAELR
jgi:hypothetical protein